jgi:hypothetical protein
MRTPRLACSVVAFLLGLAGCGAKGNSPATDGGADQSSAGPPPDLATPARPPLGQKFTAPASKWTWVDFPDSSCDDGTPTGIGVNAGASNNLIVFLNGGGACWDYSTCYSLKTASQGPFGAKEFNQLAQGNDLAGTLFDRNDAANLFKDWTFVFVPYCTGDLHGGDNVVAYTGGGVTKMYHHKGHANMAAFVPRIAGTFPSVDKVVLSGSSAGGFGTGLNYDLVRQYYPMQKVYMIDDSGPPVGVDALPTLFHDALYKQWNVWPVLDSICPDCRTDLSAIAPALAKKYPNDRFSLLSSLQDMTISGYLLLSKAGFQTAVLALASDVIDPLPRFKYFYVDGATHTMLGHPADFSTKGTSLWTFLGQQLSDDAAWKSVRP